MCSHDDPLLTSYVPTLANASLMSRTSFFVVSASGLDAHPTASQDCSRCVGSSHGPADSMRVCVALSQCLPSHGIQS